jgi:hypothetical protein
MTPITINQLIQLLQIAIGPVVLTSGIGTLSVGMMLSLVVSLVASVRDLNQAVNAFRLETDEWLKKE